MFSLSNKGVFKYYVIALAGVGGPASIADADDALRGRCWVKNQNDDVTLEYVRDKYVFM